MRHTLLIAILALFSISASAQDCEINDLIVEAHPCVNGMFFVDLDFNVVNPEGTMFGVVGNATDYGFFPYDSLYITLGPLVGDGETEYEFIVFDADEPNCQATFVLGVVTCCEITDVVVDPQDCENTETFSAIVDFDFDNTGGLGFDVFDADENSLGFFFYDELPVTVTGIPSSGTGDDVIIICDNDDTNCCTTVEFAGPDCDPNDCEIYDVVVDPDVCENGQFYVSLSFQFENVGDTFYVVGNGNDYGIFSYDDLPIVLGPFDGDGESVYEFVVVDSELNGCSDFGAIEALDCPEVCGFNDVAVEPFECVNDSTYNLELDFIPVNTADSIFSVYAGGDLLGSYFYDALPVVIENFPASGDFFDELTICDNIDTTCCETYEFQALLCAECVIYEMVVTPSSCDSNDQFYAVIDFDYQNVGPDGFQVGGNGNIYGTYGYDELPLTLGPFDGDNETFWEFVVFDLTSPLCIQGFELGLINCINPCEIGELEVDVLDCTGDGTYNVQLDFDYANTDTLGFDVWAGDTYMGFYSYDDLPITLENVPASGEDLDALTVCANDDPACCATVSYLSPGCFVECNIWDIVVEPIECTSDSAYSAIVTFFHENLESDFVDIYSEGIYLGSYPVDSLPVVVNGFPSTFGNSNITICENDNEMCCTTEEFEGLNCNTSCAIYDVAVDLGDCNDAGEYSMTVNFESQELTSVNVNISVNGETIGVYPAESAPITIEGLAGNGDSSIVVICDNDNPECCGSLVYNAPLCSTDSCEIWDLVTDGIECNDNGTYGMWINFNHSGLSSNFVTVTNNGEDLGEYPADSFPIYFDGLAGSGENVLLTVCDSDNEDCCTSIEYLAPDCETECAIFDIVVDGIQCEDDGTYGMYIVFETEGLENDFVDLWIDGEFIGFFPADTIIFVDGLPGNGENSEILICENDNDGCCGTYEYTAPDCGGCSISDLAIEPIECNSDSTFTAWIEFEFMDLDSAGIDVYVNGELIGSYPAISPLFVSNLPAGDDSVIVEVCADSFNEDCCAAVAIAQLNCNDVGCPVGEVSATASDCDSLGLFYVTLDVELEGNPGGGFIVAGNGMTYGSFGYDDLPITIGPLEGDGETPWEFIVIDLGDPDCSGFTDLGIVDCDPSSLFGPGVESIEIAVMYDRGHPFFEAPEADLEMTVWNMQGQLQSTVQLGEQNSIVQLEDYVDGTGVMAVLLRSDDKIYVAKAVLSAH